MSLLNTDLLKNLIDIGVSLSSILNLDELLSRILFESRKITRAESGSIYLKEDDKLIFKVSQNEILEKRWGKTKFKKSFRSFEMPVNQYSMAGYAVVSGKLINIKNVREMPESLPFSYNSSFDKKNDYQSHSMITLPLKTQNHRVVGVLQLINAKSNDNEIIPFNKDYEPVLQALASQAAVSILNASLTNQLKEARLDTIFRLGIAAEYRDKETAMHIKRMAGYCTVLAEALNWSKHEVERLTNAAPMHDVGKVGIPDAILLKKGRLTPEERKIMEYHTIIGGLILQDYKDELTRLSHIVAISHHEKWDGSGYPLGLKRDEIPIEGQIAAIADVYDALSSKRVYKDAFSDEKVYEIMMEGKGKHFRPDLVDLFFQEIDRVKHIKNTFTDTGETFDVLNIIGKENIKELIKYDSKYFKEKK